MDRKEYIGNKIAEARKKKRLTQKIVSEITGIDKTTISKIEKGKINATIDTIDKLCKAVGAQIRIAKHFKIFEDLVFEKHGFHKLADTIGESYPNYKESKTCYQAKIDFENGLHCSVVIGTPFISNGVDSYEVCLWSKDFQLVLGHKTNMEVNVIMEYAQMIKDLRFLELLQENKFEDFNILSFIKKIGKWWVVVNPVGKPYFIYNHEPKNFPGSRQVFCDFERFSEILPCMEEYIEKREAEENEKDFYLFG